jgi:hypothetical protein
MSGETMGLYLDLLIDLPAEPLAKAVLEHIKTKKEYPTIAELRTATAAIMDKSESKGVSVCH